MARPAREARPPGPGDSPLPLHAEVVKLVDTLASGASGGNPVEVQVLSSAPNTPKSILSGCVLIGRSVRWRTDSLRARESGGLADGDAHALTQLAQRAVDCGGLGGVVRVQHAAHLALGPPQGRGPDRAATRGPCGTPRRGRPSMRWTAAGRPAAGVGSRTTVAADPCPSRMVAAMSSRSRSRASDNASSRVAPSVAPQPKSGNATDVAAVFVASDLGRIVVGVGHGSSLRVPGHHVT